MPVEQSPSRCSITVDRANQQLWRGDTPVKVPPKVFQLLIYLRDNPGRILEYEELLDAVWPREFVQPEILKTYIKTIRRFLGDDAQTPRYIETRPRCGYAFIGDLPDRPTRAEVNAARLIGREEALAELSASWRSAAASERQFLFVVGESGIGKTRAIDEFVSRGDWSEATVSRVDCAPAQHIRQTYSPARELAAALDDADKDTIVGVCGESLHRRIELTARSRPLLLIIENLQWADTSTIEALSRLAYGRGPLGLMVICSYRPQMPNDPRCPGRTLMLDLIVHGVGRELRLRPLHGDDVKSLVLAAATEPLPRGAVETIERNSGGNPFIVSTLVREAVSQLRAGNQQSELLEMLARHGKEGEFIPSVVPPVIRHSLELQLRSLDKSSREILACGSNSGFSFCAWGVAEVLHLKQVDVEDMCKSMCGNDQLLRESRLYVFPDGSVTPVYSFRNPLYARLILADQSHARRSDVQQRFTDAVERFFGGEVGSVALEMAERFEAVREWTRALHYAKLAIANAARTESGHDTRSMVQHALRLSEHLPQEKRESERRFFLRELASMR